MKSLWKWLISEKDRCFKTSLAFWASAHALDILSTVFTLAIVPGVVEANPLGTHPLTGEFSIGGIFFAKLFFDSLIVVFPALAVYVGTGRSDAASLLFWYNGYTILPVVGQNFGILILYLRFVSGV